jgi:hypothetical protein
VDNLSNKELHTSLKKLGAEMAVTDATRKYAVKKYLELLEEADHLDETTATPSAKPLPARPRRTRSGSRLGPASRVAESSGLMSGDEESASKPVTTVTRVYRSRSSMGTGPVRRETVEQVEEDDDDAVVTTTTTTTDYREQSPKATKAASPVRGTPSSTSTDGSDANPFKYLWLALFMVVVAIVYALLTSEV